MLSPVAGGHIPLFLESIPVRIRSGETLPLCWDIDDHRVWWDKDGFSLGDARLPISLDHVGQILDQKGGVYTPKLVKL